MIELSLNEVENLAAKAARGAGLAWGVADDVGRAARRMAQAGLDWTRPVLSLATSHHPALEGVTLADLGEAITRDAVTEPLLVAALAAASGEAWEFTWPDAEILSRAGRLTGARGTALNMPGPVRLTITRHPATTAAVLSQDHAPSQRRCQVEPARLDALEQLVLRTYVPASAHSRAAGAGSSRNDNE